MLTLPSIYVLDICVFVFKNIDKFTRVEDTHNVNTRHKKRLCAPFSRTKTLSGSPYYMAVKIYNKLPNTFKTEKSPTLFQKKIKQYLIEKCFYSVKEYLEFCPK
ncbi:hypothetical protein PYW08_012997 [Mythimna loreyi]|uniref:Uncharacterized protein n=1 Tax=Mythimna loreyi TaxID=667449 RepID=A0ACC2PYT6_9NEOP|nr:hypothetical protein PYW08_012997 [Mythimna loreyi]